MDDDAAAAPRRRIIAADQAVRMLQIDAHQDAWFEALALAATSALSHPMLAGRCARILAEHGQWDPEHAAQQLALHCSAAVPPLAVAHWLEGFPQGSGARADRRCHVRAGASGNRGRSSARKARAAHPAHSVRQTTGRGACP